MKKKPLELVFEAMYHGKYDFADFVAGDISRNYELIELKDRNLFKPNKRLKAYHSLLNLFLFEYLQTNEQVVFSYRKGTNVHDAVSRHANNRYFFQSDFSDFFHSLTSAFIRTTIVDSLDRSPLSDVDHYIDRIVDLVTVEGTMPIGFSTSPLISNACLFHFDNALLAYCLERGLTYTRYSDDLIVSSDSKESLQNIHLQIESIAAECFGDELKINESKSKYSSRGNKIKLLGMVILPNGKVSVDMKLKKNVEVLLHFYLRDRQKFLELVEGDLKAGLEKISGYLNYINTVDQAYLDKLRKKYGLTIVDMFIHKSAK